jgi:D-galactose 1-dehydrogenase
LYTTWHSREADQIDRAQQWLKDKRVLSVNVNWKEDVRMWHPGQKWIWEAGGLGVFDAGINALSIITKILPEQLVVKTAELLFPSNRQTPIAATIDLVLSETDAPCHVELDWRQIGRQIWEINIMTDQGILLLAEGGSNLFINDRLVFAGAAGVSLDTEYPRLYRKMAELVRQRKSYFDVRPLQLVSDALLIGERRITPPFEM